MFVQNGYVQFEHAWKKKQNKDERNFFANISGVIIIINGCKKPGNIAMNENGKDPKMNNKK